jgi:hypothetical protein
MRQKGTLLSGYPRFTGSAAFLDTGCHMVKMKGGFEQLPNYIKGIGDRAARLISSAFSRKRRALAAAESSSISKNPSIGDSPNALPQHRIRSARSDIRQPLTFFHPGVCFWNRTRARGVVRQDDSIGVPPTRIVRLRNPGFPHRGFFVDG